MNNSADKKAEQLDDGRPTVCQLLHGLSVGGAEVLAFRMAQRLSEWYRFVYICLDHLGELGEELRRDGTSVHVLKRRPGFDTRCAWRLARLLREERVAIIHAHQYTPFSYALAARLGRSSPAVIFTEHGRHHPDFPRPRRMLFNRLMLGRRDRVAAVGRDVKRALVVNEGFPDKRVEVVYNGIDLSPYAINPPEAATIRETCRTEIGLKSGDFVIVQVARLDALKDHLTAIRTIERLSAVHRGAHLVLVGEGPEREAIETEIRQRRLERRVHLLGLRHDVPRILAAADVCLLTSISEGIPLTLIEAMAARLPVVSTGVGGVPEVIEDGLCGFLAPAKDDARLAEVLMALASNPTLRTEMGEAGRRRSHERFSEDQMHSSYNLLYAELLSARAKGRAEPLPNVANPVPNS